MMENKLFDNGLVAFKLSFTTRCSANCTTCLNPTINEHYDLEEKVFKKYINQILELPIKNPIEISFYNIGEVYMHPHFVELCEWAISRLNSARGGGQRRIRTSIVTNASHAYKVPKGIDYYDISFNGGKKQTYESITNLDFDRVVNNIYHLYDSGELRKARHASIRMLCFDGNQGEEEDFLELFHGMKHIRYRLSYLYDNQFGKTEYNALVNRSNRKPCEYITNKVNLYPNGDINLCAHDFKDTVSFGNLKDLDLIDILGGKKRMELLEMHRNNIFEGICSQCNFNADRKADYIKTGYFCPVENAVFQSAKFIYRKIKSALKHD